MENIVQGRKVQDINWVSIYEFVDTCLEDGYMKRLLNKNRERLLQSQFDII